MAAGPGSAWRAVGAQTGQTSDGGAGGRSAGQGMWRRGRKWGTADTGRCSLGIARAMIVGMVLGILLGRYKSEQKDWLPDIVCCQS